MRDALSCLRNGRVSRVLVLTQDLPFLSSRRRRSPSPPPTLPTTTGGGGTATAPIPSKMDKYFSPTYDPRLDYTLTDVTDPSTGLIAEGAFDGWDRMLETVRARKEDKSSTNSDRATREGREEEREKSERRRERERRRKKDERRKAGRATVRPGTHQAACSSCSYLAFQLPADCAGLGTSHATAGLWQAVAVHLAVF